VNGRKVEPKLQKCGKTLQLTVSAKNDATVEISFEGCTYLTNMDKKQELIQTIAKFQMANDYKGMLFTDFLKNEKPLPPMAESFAGPIREIMKLYRG
jgi:hypothetical protein